METDEDDDFNTRSESRSRPQTIDLKDYADQSSAYLSMREDSSNLILGLDRKVLFVC